MIICYVSDMPCPFALKIILRKSDLTLLLPIEMKPFWKVNCMRPEYLLEFLFMDISLKASSPDILRSNILNQPIETLL